MITIKPGVSETRIDHGDTLDITVHGSLTLISILTKAVVVKRMIRLEGDGSSFTEHTIIVGDKQFDVLTDVTTNAPNSRINVDVRGIITGVGVAKAIGNLHIKRGAVKSESKLSQHLLLASQDARAEAIPNLEIDENDVKAGHAATVRPLNADHLFYLESRGLSLKEARALLLHSFLAPALLDLPEDVQQAIRKEIEVADVLLA